MQMQDYIKEFERIEGVIEGIADSQEITEAVFSKQILKNYLHFITYSKLQNEFYNKQDDNTLTIYNFAKNYDDEETIDGRDNEVWYKWVLDQYKKLLDTNPNYDTLISSTNSSNGKQSYSLPKQDSLAFYNILKLNSSCNSTDLRSTYRKFKNQKFSSISFEDMKELYYFFYNIIQTIEDKDTRNIESYKLNSSMRFHTINLALSKIAEFELKSPKLHLKEKMDSLYRVIVQVFKQTPASLRHDYIKFYCDLAHEDMNESNMDPLEFEEQCIKHISMDYIMLVYAQICIFEELDKTGMPGKEIVAKGINKYSHIFASDYFSNELQIKYDFTKKHYDTLMKHLEDQFTADKKQLELSRSINN